MSEQRSGYFYIQPIQPNIFSTADLAELVEQIEQCKYRCEAGPIENNLAFIELKERVKERAYKVVEVAIMDGIQCDTPAKFMMWVDVKFPYKTIYACQDHLADLVEDGQTVSSHDIPNGEDCCFRYKTEREKRFPVKLERALLISVLKNANACLDYIYEFEQVPDGELQNALHVSIQRIGSLLYEDIYETIKDVGCASKQGIQCGTPAEFMLYSPKFPLDPTYSCRDHLADMVEDGNIVALGDIPDQADCCFCFKIEPEKVIIHE